MTSYAPQIHTIHPDAVRLISIDMTNDLDSGETLSGTPTVAELVSSDLTITGETINGGAVVVNGRSVAASSAMQALVSTGIADTNYEIQFSCSTTAGQTLVVVVRARCRSS